MATRGLRPQNFKRVVRQAPRVASGPEMLEKLYTIVHAEVSEAVRPVIHLEKLWAESEMVKRIVRYVCKAASHDDVLTLHWEQGLKKFIVGAMQSYSASCQEREWFYELDLAPTFQRAAWEVLTAVRDRHGADYRVVEEIAECEYQAYLDETLNNKAMWVAVSNVVSDSKNQAKMFGSLQRTYQVALDFVLSDTRPLEDLQRLESFLRKWMEDSLARMWNCVGEPERNLTEEIAVKLFRQLMAPFGTGHTFSCVPQVLTERIGQPPAKWPFIVQTVRGIFRSWNSQQASGAAAKKRKRKAEEEEEDGVAMTCLPPEKKAPMFIPKRGVGAVAEDDMQGDDQLQNEELGLDAEAPPEGEEDFDAEPQEGGHPSCTSQEDCQGTEDDVLIRHILNGRPGDVYCNTCWGSFLEQNPQLEGKEEV